MSINKAIIRKRRTHQQYVEELNNCNPNIELIDTFVNMVTKINHRCKICGHIWMTTPHEMFRKNRGHCPKCAKLSAGQRRQNQRYQIGQDIVDEHRNITITNVRHQPRVNGSKIWVYQYKCHNCGFDCGEHYINGTKYLEYWTTQDNLNEGKGCPCCQNRVIVTHINSILAHSKDTKYMVEYFPNKEDAGKYPLNYSKKLLMQCPDCKRTKMISPHTIQCCGFGCVCGDGFSYPEKFMFNILEQLNIPFEHHKSFSWSKQTEYGNKIYDFYIQQYDMIVETHGLQHYQGVYRKGARTIEEEKENDLFKRKLAMENNIKHYIELNCSESNSKFIYKSIIDSRILQIFNVDTSKININLADKFATSNIVKQCADLWNDGVGTYEISLRFKINRVTTRRYLRKASQLGWCKYDKQSHKTK